jgi:hypothetical protein
MIKINAKSGGIKWGDCDLSLRLTHEEFLRQYPSIQLSNTRYSEAGNIWHRYNLLPQEIGRFSTPAKLSFKNGFIVGIFIDSESLPILTADNWQGQLNWILDARELLTSQLGEPHQVERSHLLAEEDYLPIELTSQFQEWRYIFEWGIVHLGHESLEWVDHVGFRYHRSQQIRTWEEYIKQVEIQILNAEQYEKDCVPSLKFMLEVVKQISSDFDYQTHLPGVGCRSMGLKIANSRSTLGVRISQAKHRHLILQRTDSVDSYTVPVEELNNQLLKML